MLQLTKEKSIRVSNAELNVLSRRGNVQQNTSIRREESNWRFISKMHAVDLSSDMAITSILD